MSSTSVYLKWTRNRALWPRREPVRFGWRRALRNRQATIEMARVRISVRIHVWLGVIVPLLVATACGGSKSVSSPTPDPRQLALQRRDLPGEFTEVQHR